ncbi:DUF3306 domain-containing protein [Acidovorax sp. SRB_24]|uniref:DUF3306 domain-containing protein n=1 Tax=Acidovorax sp. SRB_24 TaxID=1962700 RepID=UPI00145F0393|nr:DUF3306 domain-containing protein [Acidovorax sp. SRB_24]NMM75261.1 hypothetical protein [Acidovorax sp. SRB_24]
MAKDDGFLSRWSQRKVQARVGEAPALTAAAAQAHPAEAETADVQAPVVQPSAPKPAPPPPTLDDVAALTRESDFTRFVKPEVSGEVRNAALKKLFSDPHFNVMDGLDTYIDDYSKPDPLPASMLRKMAQAAYLGLVEPEPGKAHAERSALPPAPESALELAQQSPHECAADNVSAAISSAERSDAAAMKVHDEDPDLRLQSHHAPGSPGPDPGSGEDPRGQC